MLRFNRSLRLSLLLLATLGWPWRAMANASDGLKLYPIGHFPAASLLVRPPVGGRPSLQGFPGLYIRLEDHTIWRLWPLNSYPSSIRDGVFVGGG